MRAKDVTHLDTSAAQSELPSVFILAHSHPALSRGGAEIAAQTLYHELQRRGARVWFMGVASGTTSSRLGTIFTQPYDQNDYLYSPSTDFDYFKFANPDPDFPREFSKLLGELRPKVVHMHHYARLGVEAFAIVKRILPDAKLVLTLHEYLAVCNHHGQMVKTGSLRLCNEATPSACMNCFPQYGERDFFLRKRYIQRFFDHVDTFISPSQFLAERYVAWGVPPEKMVVLENVPPKGEPAAYARSDQDGGGAGSSTNQRQIGWRANFFPKLSRESIKAKQNNADINLKTLKVAFFGQMSPLKGIKVLIEAALLLQKQRPNVVQVDIFGDYSNQPPDFQAAVRKALIEGEGTVHYHGPYQNKDVNKLMKEADIVVVPSTWWENSPVVIQEAFANGRPVVCSNIGGLAEKVTDGIDGLRFQTGSSIDLARVLLQMVDQPELLNTLKNNASQRETVETVVSQHLKVYEYV